MEAAPGAHHAGRNAYTSITTNAHFTAGSAGVVSHPVAGGVTGWHVCAFMWTPGAVEFYVADVLVAPGATPAAQSASATPYIGVDQPFHVPFQLTLNLAVGGWAGPTDGTTPDPTFVYVDWVRVWALDSERYVNVPVLGIGLDRETVSLLVDFPTQADYIKDRECRSVPHSPPRRGKIPRDPTVLWSSSDEGIATAGGGGVIGRSPGTCTVTATARDGNHTATCLVTVTA